MYLYTPDEIDRKRAHHQAVNQEAEDVPTKRRGNLGELAFEQFCREFLPVQFWTWKNEEALRKCNPESFSSYDFEVFGYEIDVKTSRDVSAFRPDRILEQDSDSRSFAQPQPREARHFKGHPRGSPAVSRAG